jgi:hypothetical protein
MARTLTQTTVHLTPEMRDFLAAEAEREELTIAGQIRHCVVEAMRRAERQPDKATAA